MKHYAHLADLQALVGQEMGCSDWLEVDQARIDLFAQATGDHQWIHTDPVRAAAGPYGATVAHGFLTVSLLPVLFQTGFDIGDVRMGVNYGVDKVRFPAPVPVGSRIRGVSQLVAAEEVKGGAVQATVRVTIEIEGGERPACVVDTISRFVPA